jgi:hypothetical protein
MGCALSYGGSHYKIIPPVVSSIDVNTEDVISGQVAALISRTLLKFPKPKEFLARTLNL